MSVITRSIRLLPCAAKESQTLFMKSMAVAAVSLSLASVYARQLFPSTAEWRYVCRFEAARPCFAELGSFSLLGPADVGTPSAAVSDATGCLDVDVHHLSYSFCEDELRFPVSIGVRLDESAAVQSPGSANFRDRSSGNDTAGAQLERKP